jgi:dolichol-phosphate mannosyltransferase/undecaprenyl-phosphate 4-deoxy-4-formamido-L-arabinose transferase
MSRPLYSIVVPVYKSEKTLRELHERIDRAFALLVANYELILVEDCGEDNSWQVMRSLRRADSRVKIVRLTRNFGQHNALMCGFSLATGDYVITMDDDLQNPPEEIHKLINAIRDTDFDVVYGVPEERRQNTVRKLSSIVYSFVNSMMFKRVSGLRISNFRIMRKPIVEEILKINTPNPIVGHLLLKVTDHVGAVTVMHHARLHGRTTYSTGKLLQHFLHGVLYNSTLPLKLVSGLGIACLFVSGILALYYLALYLIGSIGVSGFTTLVLLILFFSGVIMFSIGIIGEYLLRIIQEVGRPPQYVIKDMEV